MKKPKRKREEKYQRIPLKYEIKNYILKFRHLKGDSYLKLYKRIYKSNFKMKTLHNINSNKNSTKD